jgi:formate hydrogenlyase transcriptional activator
VRVVTATNRDLHAAIAEGRFRDDLFYRLNVFPIEVPPLRERKEDVPLLVEYFVDRYTSQAGKKITGISKKSMELLQTYRWPGNIRELQNVIERSVIISDSENLCIDESWFAGPSGTTDSAIHPFSEKLAAQEREMIESALAESNGRVSGSRGAAAKLGIPQSTLDSKIKALKINKQRFRRA